jgi:hypothetical protein
MQVITSARGEGGSSQSTGDPDPEGVEEGIFASSAQATPQKGDGAQTEEKNKITPVAMILETIRPPQKFLIKWHRSSRFVKLKLIFLVMRQKV